MPDLSQSRMFLKANGIYKDYRLSKHSSVRVLKGVDLEVRQGEWLALLGASGSGKTTLLNLLGTLEQPDRGEIYYQDLRYSRFSARQKVFFRCRKIGFIFQAYHMFPELTVLENVVLPAMLGGKSGRELTEKAEQLLERTGLGHRVNHRPNELSGGEQQRAAIARALINSPELILADEPTGNLDSKTGTGILEIFKELHSDEKTAGTIIMVTHNREVAALADRTIFLRDGLIDSEIT
jgi:ABC-type lipoprotein export system ATPase subunit